ncbi:predicted protein [Phaeodactylum tricornutum CCAP 1055/1]|jgi:hypothetical protein|uniref:PDZ domain-containing protein n=1 Tax=Phaeodactylum tricornutum (strain CCAP 1055/1) TaxID=556484 RepID=B7G1D9_PHATC|nr:predicted protein [Phaeodactylum tricornutum CCAP 1055/1]EEC47490.1 predicted protein [Phaeodactylum tricornutum CCAP 1055/1]|eukprot:XP_002180838.1 predicted protein [Phaeodactylum tricornutum CCAP 1055/1]
MNNFFDRFKPKSKDKSSKGRGNPLASLGLGGPKTFGGKGQSLGGNLPGEIISIELSEHGPLGLQVEKRSNTQKTAIVAMVVEGSQAEKAGLQRGDILCFQGSEGMEEILYDMFLELAKSNQRPLCFEVRRVSTRQVASTSTSKSKSSADSYARKQAVIAAAETREKAAKQKYKPIPKTKNLPTLLSAAERQQIEEDRLARAAAHHLGDAPQTEAAKAAAAAAKEEERKLAVTLGYNPYEPNRTTAGQARHATVATKHGSIKSSSQENGIPSVAPPKDAVMPEVDDTDACSDEFEAAFELTVTTNSHDIIVNSFGILRKLMINATTKGQQEGEESAKFLRVRLGNPKIKATVLDVEGALDLMRTVGFEWLEEGGDSFLVFPKGCQGPLWLPSALRKMERYESS